MQIRLFAQNKERSRLWFAAVTMHGLLFLLLFAVAPFIQTPYLQDPKKAFRIARGSTQTIRTLEPRPLRGPILDRNGVPLALSVPAVDLWTDPASLNRFQAFEAPVSELLGLDLTAFKNAVEAKSKPPTASSISEMSTKRAKFLFLARAVEPELARKVLNLHAPGVFATPTTRRIYPEGEAAANIIGICDIDSRGVDGIELSQNAQLKGKLETEYALGNAKGEDLIASRAPESEVTVTLTIDTRLQELAYHELVQTVNRHHGDSGILIAADPRTGEILAMASYPSSDSNAAVEYRNAAARNRPVTDNFEAGPTIEPLLIAQGLDTGHLSVASLVDTGHGTLKIDKYVIHDAHPNGVISLSGVLAKTSNIGAAKIGRDLGAQLVGEGYQRFGLGGRTGIGLPGEAMPLSRPWQQWRPIETATASFGYGISVTSIGLLQAYCAIANDGLMPVLSIVRRNRPSSSIRVIGQNTAQKVRALMAHSEETSSIAGSETNSSRFTVADTAGMVHMTNAGRYDRGVYRSLYVGMAPADLPRIVVLVEIEHPRETDAASRSISRPVFNSIAAAALRMEAP